MGESRQTGKKGKRTAEMSAMDTVQSSLSVLGEIKIQTTGSLSVAWSISVFVIHMNQATGAETTEQTANTEKYNRRYSSPNSQVVNKATDLGCLSQVPEIFSYCTLPKQAVP